MNKLFLFISAVVVLLPCYIFSTINDETEILKKDKPDFKQKSAPPGTVWLRDSVFIDVNPVTNLDYRSFIGFLKDTYSKSVRDSLKNLPAYGVRNESFKSYMRLEGPDEELRTLVEIPSTMTLGWNMEMNEYLNSNSFSNYPVVNVSYKQANLYSEWRTDVTMLYYSCASKDEKDRDRRYYKKIRYRLPTVDEWQYAIEKFGKNIFTNYASFAGERCATYSAIPQKKNIDFFYIPRNVAEMSSQEKTALGMSWRDTDTTQNYTKVVNYKIPGDYIGFRCVCEIVEY